MWSSAWFSAAARLLAVGVVTGALAAVVLVLGVTALEGGTLLDVGELFFFAAAVGAACAVPTAAACAATGLVVAARWPRRRRLALGLLMTWPVVATALAVQWVVSSTDQAPAPAALLGGALLGLVAACVAVTRRWVTAPLSAASHERRWSSVD